jgi:ribosomal protein S18 acetylase RimI-like enzyme
MEAKFWERTSMITDATPTEYSVAIQIHAVMQAAYTLEADRIGFAEFPPLRESLEELRQSSDSFLVFQQSGRIIGGLSFRRRTDTVAITRLVVSPEHLRQGIAIALLSELECRLFRITRLTVSTAATNTPAISLYKRFGFTTASASTSAEGIPLLHLLKA